MFTATMSSLKEQIQQSSNQWVSFFAVGSLFSGGRVAKGEKNNGANEAGSQKG